MTNFHEAPRFPEDISYGFSGGPTYSTLIGEVLSGDEDRSSLWENGRCEYEAAHGVKTQAQLKTLSIFFRNRKGRRIGFRVKDWVDYQVSVTEGILGTGVGNGTASYQLYKNYTDAGGTETRIIQKPVSGTVKCYKDGTLLVEGGGAGQIAISYTTGIITFVAPYPTSSNVLTWEGEFDVPCRFDTDKFSPRVEDYNIYSWNQIPLKEIRIP